MSKKEVFDKDLEKDDPGLALEVSEDDGVEEVDEPDLGELADHLQQVNRDFEASEDYDEEDD